ncbi:MAG: endolytic transglycosylase MltG [Bacteroidia bacterium]|nr:endolytic transglycosylase MltG [Bacteroidia bacterium]
MGLLLLAVVGLGALQIIAPIRVNAPKPLYLPLSDSGRYRMQREIQALFPPYTVWHWIIQAQACKPGYYLLFPTQSAFEVWRRFTRGIQTPFRFYLRPQRSAAHLAHFLGNHLAVDSATWHHTFLSYPWKNLGLNEHTWLAIFLPDVYEVYWTVPPEKFIARMKERYDHFWSGERMRKAAAIGLSPMEVMTLASIVEYETYRSSEKPLIASVYLNRLRLGMPLQADPTVIYAVGDFRVQRVTHRMTEVESPYNTYRRRGLPPGPIGTPSIESIDAVLSYTPSDYLYFCARSDGSGYHDFSRTYPEHLVKARTYQRALNRWLAQKQ